MISKKFDTQPKLFNQYVNNCFAAFSSKKVQKFYEGSCNFKCGMQHWHASGCRFNRWSGQISFLVEMIEKKLKSVQNI